MTKRRNEKKVRDLVEMMQDPDSSGYSGYIGSDCDAMELYEQELEEMEGADGLYDGELDFN